MRKTYSFFCMPVVAACLLLQSFSSCNKSRDDKPLGPAKDLILTATEKQKATRDNLFTFSLLQRATRTMPDGQNTLISPLSVSIALGMTANGANGETQAAFKQVLGFGNLNYEEVNSYYKKLLEELPALDPKTTLDIANSIWYRQGFSVLPGFLNVNRDYFSATVEELDFSSPDATERINGWVDQKTHGKIDKIIEEIPGDMVMYLINAIYFKGDWEQKFDKSKTRKVAFHRPSGTPLQTDFMNVEHRFRVLRNNEVSGVELPYGNDKYSMVMLLPAAGATVADLIELLNQDGVWNTWESQFSPVLTNLWVPKFKFSYENKLNDELIDLGLGIAFSGTADFTGINPDGRLQISEVKHKSFIEVHEEGTEAAAVTSVGIELTSMPQIHQLTLDRPFLFLIREKGNGLILFAGQLNDPSSEENKAP